MATTDGMDGGVLVSQPVHQHAYETAVAAQEAGVLCCFLTGLYYRGGNPAGPRAPGWLPPTIGLRLERELRRRWHPELEPTRVITIPWYHAFSTGFRRGAAGLPWLRDLDFDTWAHRRFDAAVGRRLLRVRSLAAVHAFEGAALATFRSARRKGIQTILDVPSAHERFAEVEQPERGRGRDPRIPAERKLADYLFAPSDFVVDCLVEAGVPPERIVKIPYGVDPSRFRPPAGDRPNEPFRALFVGQIGVHKGVPSLLEAWRRLSLPGAELVLVGPVNRVGRKLLERSGDVCRWVGALPKHEVHRWFAASDIFVFPSLAEGSALVTYEAMAAGLPLVTTPNSGSVMRDGVDGFLVPPRDVDALCDRIRFLHDHPDVRHGMGRRARAVIQEGYTWAHYRQRVVAAYQAIQAGRPVRQPAVTGEG